MNRVLLLLEFLTIFFAGPLVAAALRQRFALALLLWAVALAAWLLTRREIPPQLAPGARGRELRGLGLRFALLGPLLALATWLYFPDSFLSLPLERPWLWLAVLALYPLLSVWPQEALFRRFLLLRYQRLFGPGAGSVLASAAAFGFAHIVYGNALAVGLSAAGGLLFATSYRRHRSLALVCLEHALYGCLVFTIGLGRFFYTGATWRP